MFRYVMFEESLQSDELGKYQTFGIKVLNPSGDEITSVSDVSVSRELVRDIC